MSVYNFNGKIIGVSGDYYVNSVAHRGFNAEAPENTIPAFILAKKKGFDMVETDVSFTSDGVAVLLHDSTVDRTSDGTGNINSLTFEQVRALDFGSWKSSKYAGTQIPTFEEFIILCKRIAIHPYIEIKNGASYTVEQIRSLIDIVDSHGMTDNVTWLSFNATYLGYVHEYAPKASLLLNVNSITSNAIQTAVGLRDENTVLIGSSSYSDVEVARCKAEKIPLVVGQVNTEAGVLNLNPYITGVSSDCLHAGEVLYNSIMGK